MPASLIAGHIKLHMQVESITNHDVKAIEYVLKKRFQANSELEKV